MTRSRNNRAKLLKQYKRMRTEDMCCKETTKIKHSKQGRLFPYPKRGKHILDENQHSSGDKN